MVSINATETRPGVKLLIDGEVYNIVEREHHKPGKGGAFVRFKLKNLVSGRVIERTVRSDVTVEQADVTTMNMQFLYKEGDDYVFMDLNTYEQISIPGEMIGFGSHFLTADATVQVTMFQGRALGLALPAKMDFEVVDTIDAVRGNTATNVTKDARLENGLTVQVPLFIKQGDRVRILTDDGSYVERAN